MLNRPCNWENAVHWPYVRSLNAPPCILRGDQTFRSLYSPPMHTFSHAQASKTQGATIRFLSPDFDQKSNFVLDVITDGAMANKGDDKGREGYIIFRRLGNIVHRIQWSARRLRRVSRSSSTAKTIAPADAASSGLYLKHVLVSLLPSPQTSSPP